MTTEPHRQRIGHRRAGMSEHRHGLVTYVGSCPVCATEPGTPQTAAGVSLWMDMTANSGGEALHPLWVEHLRVRILAIEAEARAARDAEVRAAVEALHRPGRSDINYRAVLAILDADTPS